MATNLVAIVDSFGENSAGDIRRFAVADSAAIKVGACLVMSDPRTAASHATVAQGIFAGISTEEKKAGDGITTIGAAGNIVGNFVASGALPMGSPVVLAEVANTVKIAPADASGAEIVGNTWEAVSTGERVNVRINR